MLENNERKRSMRKGRQRYETNLHPNSNKHKGKLLIINQNLIEQKCPCLCSLVVNESVLTKINIDIFSKMRVTERRLRRRKRAVRRKKRAIKRKRHDVRRRKRLGDGKKLNNNKSMKKPNQNRKQYTRKQANQPCKSLSPQICMRKLLSRRKLLRKRYILTPLSMFFIGCYFFILNIQDCRVI